MATELKLTVREAAALINEIGNIKTDADTKLKYAKDRSLRYAKAFIDSNDDELDEVRSSRAATEKVGKPGQEKELILREENGNYRFTAEGLTELRKDIKTYNDKIVTIKLHTVKASDVPYSEVSGEKREFLTEQGFIVEEQNSVG